MELVVRVDLTGFPLNDKFLSLLEEATFVVKARKISDAQVTLSVTDPVRSKDYTPIYFPKVQEKITVVETASNCTTRRLT